jgi:hypothetical protein
MNYTENQLKYLRLLEKQKKAGKISNYIYKKEVSYVNGLVKK